MWSYRKNLVTSYISDNNMLRVEMGGVGHRFDVLNYGCSIIGSKIEKFYERIIQDGTDRKRA